MGYSTKSSVSGKPEKRCLEYHISVLHDETTFDQHGREFQYQDEPIFPSTI